MILVALALLGFGVVDLVRWSPDDVAWPRAIVAAIAGTAAVGGVAALSGMDSSGVLLAIAISFVILLLWSAYESAALTRLEARVRARTSDERHLRADRPQWLCRPDRR